MRLRLFLLALAALPLSLLPGRAADGAGSFHGTPGLQLWSLREEFKRDGVPATLDRVKAMGFTEVETAGFYNLPVADFRRMLEERGLKATSAHFSHGPLTKDLAACVRDAKALGVRFAVCPFFSHEIGNFTEADARRAAADFNRFGEAFAAEGIQFAYHPHGYEFRPHGDGTLMDIILQETKPELVAFEMDVFWVVHPGADPVKYLEKYPGRWVLMHLKDIRRGARTGVYTGSAPKTDDVPLGTGQVPWPAVLAAAHRAGVKHYFLEDESPTAADQLKESLRYLGTLKASQP